MIREMQFGFKKLSRGGMPIYDGAWQGLGSGMGHSGETGRMCRDDYQRGRPSYDARRTT
jgi:hypothetical protein